ncbi:MAG: superoxide dismutase [Nanoarchaeota archaeon]
MLKLPKLKYNYDSLEPYIDKETIKVHHEGHHQTYLNNLNQALANYPNLQKKPVDELIKNPKKLPNEARTKILQNGGQFLNHNLYFEILKKDVKPLGEILNLINKNFGNFERFKEKFSEASLTLFGSGWVWLTIDKKKLEIIKTKNHESPIIQNKKPILTIDVWEHAYYLKYQNKRKDYIESFFHVINWNRINSILKI